MNGSTGTGSTVASGTVAPGTTLRFAVAMRGGVSLAIWIGGALAEIDVLRRASIASPSPSGSDGSAAFYRRVLGLTTIARVEVDVLAGASAGGLNAVLGAACLAQGKPIESLAPIWMDTAGIDTLLKNSDVPRRSVLDGEYFRKELEKQFDKILGDSALQPDFATVSEAFLALTVLGGVEVVNGVDPLNSDKRRSAFAHFRHKANDPALSDFKRDGAAVMAALMARSTASFPVAFEPVQVNPTSLAGILNLPDPGAATSGLDTSDTTATLLLYDGGVLDNIPVARAIRAVGNMPSVGPVRRWVVFLHPSPEGAPEAPASSDGFFGRAWQAVRKLAGAVDLNPNGSPLRVVKDLISAGTESLLDDLDVLVEHNRSVEIRAVQSTSIAIAAFSAGGAVSTASYAASDADRIYELHRAPAATMTGSPIGSRIQRSELSTLDSAANERFAIRAQLLTRAMTLTDNPDTRLIRPFARLIRQCYTLIEWIRWLERNYPALDASSQRAVVYDTLTLARLVEMNIEMKILAGQPCNGVQVALDGAGHFDRDPTILQIAGTVGLRDEGTGPNASEAELRKPWLERLPTALRPTCVSLAAGTMVPASVGGAQSAISLLRERLDGVMAELAAGGALPSAVLPSVSRSLFEQAILVVPTGGPERFIRLLDRLDAALLGVHQGSTLPPGQSLNYIRISGANASPLARPGYLKSLGLPEELAFESDRMHARQKGDAGWLMNPAAKLSGNSLGNFSAFLSKRFRQNDWMWGHLDAATSVVDVLLRPDHLPPGIEPDVLVEGVRAAVCWGDGSGVKMLSNAWPLLCPHVMADAADLLSKLPSAHAGETVRSLLVLRRHLDLLTEHLPSLEDAALDPNHPPKTANTINPPPEPIRTVRRYDALERSMSDLWGQRALTVRAVQAARHLARAVKPAPRWNRTLLAVPLMIVAAAASLRWQFLIGVNVGFLGAVLPGLNGVWAVLGWATSVALSFAYWSTAVRVRPRPGDPPGRRRRSRVAWFVLLASVAIHLGSCAMFRWTDWRDRDTFTSRFGVDVFRQHRPLVLLSAIAGFVAVSLLWSWARVIWRFGFALGAGALYGVWARIGLWRPSERTAGRERWIDLFRSRFWPTLVLMIALTIVAFLRPERQNRPDKPSPPGVVS